VKAELKADHTPMGDAPNRTVLFFCDMGGEEATYRAGILKMQPEYLDPDVPAPRQYSVTELQVRQASSFSVSNKRHRAQMKTVYEADVYELAQGVIVDVPDTEVSYRCVARKDIDHGTYQITAGDRSAARQAQEQHIEWQDVQENLATARQEREAAARLAAADVAATAAAGGE
jgi:hypothetical protein